MMNSSKVAPLFAAMAITAAGVFLIASPAVAKDRTVVVQAPADEEATVQLVGYGDLNLSSANGEKILNRRVGKAVRRVCHIANPGGQFVDQWMCSDLSWADARPQIRRAVDRARGFAMAGTATAASAVIVVSVR